MLFSNRFLTFQVFFVVIVFTLFVILNWIYPLFWNWSQITYKMFSSQLDGDYSDKNLAKKFLEHTDYVVKNCPKEKLLKFEVKEGWNPLCEFLKKDIPNEEFPNVNDTEELKSKFRLFNIAGYAILSIIFLILGYGIKRFLL